MSNAHHSFLINQVEKTWNIDSFLNIQKRREDVVFRTQSNSRFVNLAYVQSESISSKRNMGIYHRFAALAENRAVEITTDQLLQSSSGFSIETDKFLVTDVFVEGSATLGQYPLFYQHKISRVLSAGESLVDIQVLDNSYSQLTIASAKKDLSVGILYSNLANTFDPETGLHNLYYVSYLVKKVNGTLERYTEILNQLPVFRAAEVEDLDAFGNILSGIKAYLIQEDIGDSFVVKLPATGTYGLRRLTTSSLQLLEPSNQGPDSPWFVSVSNSKFISSVPTAPGSSSVLKYRVAEFAAQGFAPYFPYKQTYETSYRVSKRVIKTLRPHVVIDPIEGLYPDVFVYRNDGSLKFALTGNPAKRGTVAPGTNSLYANVLLGDSRVSGLGIDDSTYPVAGSSIDAATGFIVLPSGFEILETDTISTAYHYIEDRYEFTFLDMNPLSEVDWLRQKLVIFVAPEILGSTLTKTLFYLVVSEDGLVLETDHPGLLSLVELEELWYDRDPTSVSWAQPGSIDFVQKHSVEGEPNSSAFLILGDVYIRGIGSPAGLTFNDIRLRGGGTSLENEATNPETGWYWDIKMWDGRPYPAAASYFIEIPVELLTDVGGRFTPAGIRETSMRHTAAGVYPVVWGYNTYEPTITDISYTPSGLQIAWTQHDSDAIFSVYTAPSPEGPWSVIDSGISNNPLGNTYVLQVPPERTQYILVEGGRTGAPIFPSGPLDGKSKQIIEVVGAPNRPTRTSLTHTFEVD